MSDQPGGGINPWNAAQQGDLDAILTYNDADGDVNCRDANK
jgi:hypothetical protein